MGLRRASVRWVWVGVLAGCVPLLPGADRLDAGASETAPPMDRAEDTADDVSSEDSLPDRGLGDVPDERGDAGPLDADASEAGSRDALDEPRDSSAPDGAPTDLGTDTGARPDTGTDLGTDTGARPDASEDTQTATDLGTDTGACASGLTRCGGECVDANTSPLHCGACDRPCRSGRCAAGACAPCGREGEPCCSDSSCDSGQECRSGTCGRSATTCLATGAPCASEWACCAGRSCRSQSSPGSVCCIEAEQPCRSTSECCGEMYCVLSRCACAARGRVCADDRDCCSGLRCLAGGSLRTCG